MDPSLQFKAFKSFIKYSLQDLWKFNLCHPNYWSKLTWLSLLPFITPNCYQKKNNFELSFWVLFNQAISTHQSHRINQSNTHRWIGVDYLYTMNLSKNPCLWYKLLSDFDFHREILLHVFEIQMFDPILVLSFCRWF